MLILSRKAGETIQIGSDVVIKVTNIRGGRVQIGIEAPQEVAIRRGDLEPLDKAAREQGAINQAPASKRQAGLKNHAQDAA
ncbi:carbon storage regulator [Roseimaritima sediminicola]|uniref:carbon storage regulator n=1 Tax=Roseimaritima sediminicola TaxID=2662066 RepID=UPI00129826C6|nr:carbon storage regulator [Roseimaritima sediminicola]